MNCEINQVLKNIRALNSQTSILKKSNLAKDEEDLIITALGELADSVIDYIKHTEKTDEAV